MKIRVASYNLENLFTRPSAMIDDQPNGQDAIDDHAQANIIICRDVYSDDDKNFLIALDKKYHFSALNPPANALVTLKKIRGHLFTHQAGEVLVSANGRSDWTGWFELKQTNITWEATHNTGKVIDAVKPDILICVEVENRPTLQRFNEQILGSLFNLKFPHVMLIDGNDSRGIDVGILSKFPITSIKSHIDDLLNGQPIFSRDCPEYSIELEKEKSIVICPNHFKSKRGGDDDKAKARRLAQGQRAKAIAKAATKINPYVMIAGDLNDTPDSPTLQAIIDKDWKDIQSHSNYPTERPGTYATGTASNKIDYMIMSHPLYECLLDVGIERRGTHHPKLWDSFDGLTEITEASDHHCIWADFEI